MSETEARHDYEPGEVGRPWVIASALLGTILVAAICMVGIYFLYLPFAREKPIAVSRFPAPRLQVDPSADLAALEKEQRARLHRSGWKEAEPGRAFIPIEAAMKAVAARGSQAYAPLPDAGNGRARRAPGAQAPEDRPPNPGAGPAGGEGAR